ncbi:hypothetical protein BaRGS_00024206 [Batillaria attramentaria]|uniref:Uncharacterized protein n=1 Tax=Batillaria attramentaria TaxID=370345 RepID=A0ABD0KBV4_9CAEN
MQRNVNVAVPSPLSPHSPPKLSQYYSIHRLRQILGLRQEILLVQRALYRGRQTLWPLPSSVTPLSGKLDPDKLEERLSKVIPISPTKKWQENKASKATLTGNSAIFIASHSRPITQSKYNQQGSAPFFCYGPIAVLSAKLFPGWFDNAQMP